jgi:hypothetical protein
MKEKDEKVKLTICSATNEYYKRNVEKIGKEIDLQNVKNSQVKDTIGNLEQLNN